MGARFASLAMPPKTSQWCVPLCKQLKLLHNSALPRYARTDRLNTWQIDNDEMRPGM